MASDLTLSQPAGADSLFGAPSAGTVQQRGPAFLASWRYPLVTSLAAAVIIGAVALRLWEANLPKVVLQEEGVLVVFGVAYGAVAVAIARSNSQIARSETSLPASSTRYTNTPSVCTV